FIWKYRLYQPTRLDTPEREHIEILQTGQPNTDAGPDFTNVRIRIGTTQWAGNAEIHLKASDWQRHGHHLNRAYDNVVIHLVGEKDAEVMTTGGHKILTVELKWDSQLTERYLELRDEIHDIACSSKLGKVDAFIISHWMNRMVVERLEQKSEQVLGLLAETSGDWQEVYYRKLFGALGMKVNSQPFEMLARSLPFKFILKHRDNLFQLEALLFGQAGFLSDRLFGEEYFLKLRQEYQYLQCKYSLTPIEPHLWKFMRLRPSNFPTLRIAQLANLLKDQMTDFDRLYKTPTPAPFVQWFHTGTSGFWETHYHFDKVSPYSDKHLGEMAASLLVVNAVVPVLFAWGRRNDNYQAVQRAMQYLESLSPENNKVLRIWEHSGIPAKNAFDAQALIQLYNRYCSHRHCLRCAIGNKLVTSI
ncbi:MAG: DUF2851 family protein, partial [Bacteroidales bacterium]|nr:DUF2851 family protein [Bacteroidales bacterium]